MNEMNVIQPTEVQGEFRRHILLLSRKQTGPETTPSNHERQEEVVVRIGVSVAHDALLPVHLAALPREDSHAQP